MDQVDPRRSRLSKSLSLAALTGATMAALTLPSVAHAQPAPPPEPPPAPTAVEGAPPPAAPAPPPPPPADPNA
ncbi:hypothetical protein CRI77_19585, partial [Mycolicibacterium duvalii]